MDDLIKWLGPIVTISLAVVGLRAWYWQLIAKRRFEVAEQALICFNRACDAISAIRSVGSWSSEADSIKIAEGADPEQVALIRKYGVFGERANSQAEAFKDVRLNQILCELHISKSAATAVGSYSGSDTPCLCPRTC